MTFKAFFGKFINFFFPSREIKRLEKVILSVNHNINIKLDNIDITTSKKFEQTQHNINIKLDNIDITTSKKFEQTQESIEIIKKEIELKFLSSWKEIGFLSNKQDKNLIGETFKFDTKKSTTYDYNDGLSSFFEKLKKYIIKTDVLLDIGCGVRPQVFFEPKVHICIEPYKDYRDIVKPYFPNKSFYIFIKADALAGIKNFEDSSFDTVMLIDLIEHLTKDQGLKLLVECDRVARKQIIVFTPLGFSPQHYEKGENIDAWGLTGAKFQEHKSGWLPRDFGQGWDFHVCHDSHDAFLKEEKEKNIKYSSFVAIKNKKFNGFDTPQDTPEFVKEVFLQRVIRQNDCN